MSKSRHRRQTRKRKVKRRTGKSGQPPAQFTWGNKLYLMGVPLGIFLLLLVLLYYMSLLGYRRKIQRRVEWWRSEYDLSELQAREIFELERKYHVFERPFSMRKKPTAQQREEHHRAISELLDGKDTSHNH